jgi:putative redox protein
VSNEERPGTVIVTDAGTGKYAELVTSGSHTFTADEPGSAGGDDAGPNPYDLLLAALGTCTAMTLRMYADRKSIPLERTTVRLRHNRIYAKDCADCESDKGMLSEISREIHFEGELDGAQRARLLEIAVGVPCTAR